MIVTDDGCEAEYCNSCGGLFDVDELKGEPPRCPDCLYDESHCTACNGTGEGQRDGARCSTCEGSGQIAPAGLNDDVDPPYDDDFSDKDFGPYGYSPD